MDVVVTGRHIEVSPRFRDHAAAKLAKLEKHDQRIMRVAVEVEAERNPRQVDRAITVQLTGYSKGPVIRAEAAAEDKMAALDLAVDKMASQLRKAADRRRVHRGRGARVSLGEALAAKEAELVAEAAAGSVVAEEAVETSDHEEDSLYVRHKTHQAVPMTLDQALYEMELVGHDFYLFVDSETQKPSVVYRRHAYDYGVIQLELTEPDS